MICNAAFDYDTAFARNLGLVNESEQSRLRKARVALPGLGGVGGIHLQTLARMGIGAFHLADLDHFDLANMNRQMGATMQTIGRPKCDVIAEMACGINPDADVVTFPQGISAENIGAFLNGVDVVVDGLEFFSIDVRRMLFRECRQRGIPVITAGPIGYGAAVLVFMPNGISFDEHFRIHDGMTRAEQLMAFGLGLAPGLVSDVDPAHVDIERQKGPALASACMLCAAAAATEVLKLVCGRGQITAAPRGKYIDLFRGKTLNLRPRPSLTNSLRGRVLRWLAFRRFPACEAMHQRELRQRGQQLQQPREKAVSIATATFCPERSNI